jgi:carbon-monoxide dehydrogenase medium subunit
MWREYINAADTAEVLDILAEKREKARIVAGATDLLLEIERGARRGIETLVDISRIAGLDQIRLDDAGWVHLGPLVTHNDCVASEQVREYGFPLAQAAWEVGSPQIRNRGTVAGNLITASPANDTISPLMALGAVLILRSRERERQVALSDFYTGVRATVLQPDEMLVDIAFPALQKHQQGMYLKLALRRAQAISLINLAAVISWAGSRVAGASITLGAVAPTIIHAADAEAYLIGKELSDDVIQSAAGLVRQAARPISDVRSSGEYRGSMVGVAARRCLTALKNGQEREGFPAAPIFLWGVRQSGPDAAQAQEILAETPISTTINGKDYVFPTGQEKTLLRLIREEAGLTGTKEGCAEGECGACTVFLDGKAVMSCLVPAPRAQGAQIVTIEGLANEEKLHPVQQAFIDEGAVQCGYCTPGFIMSAVKLLEERPRPSQLQIRQAISGNLCRCTGYYKIIQAIEQASGRN